MEMNPYQSPFEAASQQVVMPPGALNPSMLNQVRIVSILMIIQGVLCVLLGGLLLIAALVIGPIIQADMRRQPPAAGPEPFDREYGPMILMVVYGGMGAAGLIPGGLLI